MIKYIRIAFIIFALAYLVLGILLHVEVSFLVVGNYPDITGKFVARDYSLQFSYFIAGLVIIYLIYKSVKGERRFVTLYYWFIYFSILFFFYLIISLHQVEIIHIVQYTGVALLLAKLLDPSKEKFYFGKILFLGTCIGILDELMQYYVVSPTHTYLDFNDFLANLLGVIPGLLIYYGFKNHNVNNIDRKKFYNTKRFAFFTVITFWITYLFVNGNLKISPKHFVSPGSYAFIDHKFVVYMERIPGLLGSWQKHLVRGYYYALTPLEGILLVALICLLFSTFDPRIFDSVKNIIVNFKKFLKLNDLGKMK